MYNKKNSNTKLGHTHIRYIDPLYYNSLQSDVSFYSIIITSFLKDKMF